MRKGFLSRALTILICLTLALAAVPTAAAAQLDTSDHDKYISGYMESDGSCWRFEPSGALTRAESAALLYKLLRSAGAEPSGTAFSDVAETDWFYRAVTALASLSVINGYSDGTFRPSEPVTRAEFIAMLCRVGEAGAGSGAFADVPKDSWYASAVAAAEEKGWVSGYPDGSFRPESPVTRAEAVVVLNRVLGRSADANALAQVDFLLYIDVTPEDCWAFADIMEASISHGHSVRGGVESWVDRTLPSTGLAGGLATLRGDTYYIDERGVFLRSGWAETDGGRVYFGADGRAYSGGLSQDEGWYYLEDGAPVTGVFYRDGYWFDVDADGGARYSAEEYMTARIRDVGSDTDWLLATDLTTCCTGVYYNTDGQWALQYLWPCATGAPGHGTPAGTFKVGVKGYRFYSYGSFCYYFTGFIGTTYLYHSITYNWDDSVQDGTLGAAVSHGCVRLATENAKWICDNIPEGSTVFIY